MLALQKVFDLRYTAVYEDRVAVRVVLKDFAKSYSLPADLCTAWHLQTRLDGDEVLLQVRFLLVLQRGPALSVPPCVVTLCQDTT